MLLILVALAVAYLAREQGLPLPGSAPPAPSEAAAPGAQDANARIQRLFEQGRSGVVVEASGRAVKLLSDDREGSRHQRIILRLDNGHTLLISHNIDLAPRVPLQTGEQIDFRGQFEWNERGGVVHWTHHDPDGRRPGGWIRHRGRLYK